MIFIIDDDRSLRHALEDLLSSVGQDCRAYESTSAFLAAHRPDQPSCLVLDIRMPGKSGLDFQDDLVRLGIVLPVIVITGHADVPMTVRALKAGAIEFLTKPFAESDLLDAIATGLEMDRLRREAAAASTALIGRYETLTAREKQIMAGAVEGRLNKQIAGDLGLSEITVKVRRSQIMLKMEAGSFAELVRMASKLGVPADDR